MPDKQTSIDKGLDSLDNQIVDIVGNFVKRRKQDYEKAAQKLHTELKKDTKRYAGLLADGKLKKEDFELLVRGRWAQLKIELLTETTVSKRKFEDIAGEVLKVTVKTVLDVV